MLIWKACLYVCAKARHTHIHRAERIRIEKIVFFRPGVKSRSPTWFVGQTVKNLTWKVKLSGRVLKTKFSLSRVSQEEMKWAKRRWRCNGRHIHFMHLLLFGGFMSDEYAFYRNHNITLPCSNACGENLHMPWFTCCTCKAKKAW